MIDRAPSFSRFKLNDEAPPDIREAVAKLYQSLEGRSVFKSLIVLDALYNLTIQMKDDLANFDVILSDETSARLISLFFYELINRVRAQRGGSGLKAKILFVNNNRSLTLREREEVEKVIKKIHPNQRVLYVSEFLHSGGTLMRMAEILKQNNLDFQSAILSASPELPNDRLVPILETARAKIGQYSEVGDTINMRSALSLGVDNVMGKETSLAHPILANYHDPLMAQQSRESVNKARKDIKILAEVTQQILFN